MGVPRQVDRTGPTFVCGILVRVCMCARENERDARRALLCDPATLAAAGKSVQYQ